MLDGLPHDHRELVGIARLGDVTENVPLVDRVDNGSNIDISGEQQPGRLRPDGLGLAQDLDARHFRHPLVAENHVGNLAGPQILERLGTALKCDHLVVDAQPVTDRVEHISLVIHHQQTRPRALHRRSCFFWSLGGCFRSSPTRRTR